MDEFKREVDALLDAHSHLRHAIEMALLTRSLSIDVCGVAPLELRRGANGIHACWIAPGGDLQDHMVTYRELWDTAREMAAGARLAEAI